MIDGVVVFWKHVVKGVFEISVAMHLLVSQKHQISLFRFDELNHISVARQVCHISQFAVRFKIKNLLSVDDP